MRITPSSFFSHYIINPLAVELSWPEKAIAVAFSTLIGALTLGIAQAIVYSKWSSRKVVKITPQSSSTGDYNPPAIEIAHTKLHARYSNLERLASQIASIKLRVLGSDEPMKLAEVPKIIQEQFIATFYSKPLPKKEDVTVPWGTDGTIIRRRWVELNTQEKIIVNNTGTREHNQVAQGSPGFVVDARFFADGQEPFLPGDPRQSHGNDHCSRAAIFAGVFAYLYHKYHPDYEVSSSDIAICQLLGAGHDSGRQTEGPDVYDRDSADNTVKILRDLGIRDEALLSQCHEAIADKDSPPTASKSLFAKALQNADSADFARLYLYSDTQSDKEFERAREFLDIFKELKTMATLKNTSDPKKAVLKNGLTFEDFCFELDALRTEMNAFIFQTHQKEIRTRFTEAHDHYFSQVTGSITPLLYPLLHATASQIGLIPPVQVESPEFLKAKFDQENIFSWQRFGFEKIATKDLERFQKCLEDIKEGWQHPHTHACVDAIKALLRTRNEAETAFEGVLSSASHSEEELFSAYYQLPALLKAEKKDSFEKAWEKFREDFSPAERLEDHIRGSHNAIFRITCQTLLADLKREDLDRLIRENSENEATLSEAKELQTAAHKLAKLYKRLRETSPNLSDLLDPSIATSIALAFERASWIFQKEGHLDEAKAILLQAATEVSPPSGSTFADLAASWTEQSSLPQFLEGDSGFIRRRKIRVAEKSLSGSKIVELNFELPTWVRKRLDERIKLLPDSKCSEDSHTYLGALEGLFSSKHGEIGGIGKNIKIKIADGVTISFGKDPYYWTAYTSMKVECRVGVPAQKVHEALSLLGLPMTLMPSRKEDRANQALASALSFHFPKLTHEHIGRRVEPETIYNKLNAEQKAVIDNSISKMRLSQVGVGHFEFTNSSTPKEAWKAGARAFSLFVAASGGFQNQADVVAKILRNGFQSSKERFLQGILGYGCAPVWNYRTGSSNQVFTRLFTRHLFESNLSLETFPVSGRIMFLLDLKAFERQPYGYLRDYGGMRSPEFYAYNHTPQNQATIFDLHGETTIRDERFNFLDFIKFLNAETFPNNELMFDQTLDKKYIKKLVVRTETEKIQLIANLIAKGLTHINGQPLNQVIIASDKLTPEMVDGFETDEMKEPSDDTESLRIGLF